MLKSAATFPTPGKKTEVHPLLRALVIGLMAFLTVVDLFAAQALLPSLAAHYQVSPAAMGLAVNACTFGMAAAGLAIALYGARLDARIGITASLALLAIPTVLLAYAPNLEIFAGLRVVQGVLMATAFSLTLGYLGMRFDSSTATGAVAAYITGNVASNLFGRMIAASVVGHSGLAAAFYVFAVLNLLGAALALILVDRMRQGTQEMMPAVSSHHLKALITPPLLATFTIAFCILFAFIGTFTYVNFVLTREPLSVGMMQLGLIYLVFLPSILTTPFAGSLSKKMGSRRALWLALALAAAGLPLLLSTWLLAVLSGMALVAVGTFGAQAIATGYVGQAAGAHRSAASGLYLASYYLGGLAGTAILGQVFDGAGWTAAVTGIGLSVGIAALLALFWRPAAP